MEEEMGRVLGSDHPYLNELAHRIMDAPGKRLRPKLLILTSKMLNYNQFDAITFALVFELVHTATLIHDDIIDEAQTRRGKATLNHDMGNTLTVLYGDLLYTKAHTTGLSTGRVDVLQLVNQVSERMIEGELLQHKVNFETRISEETYFDILTRKTAYLFAGATKAAGLLANCSEDQCEALFQFGFNFGISFQLMDDYLNYMGSERVMGKPVLSDLKDGKVTLPIIKLLNSQPETARDMITRLWDGDMEAESALMQAIRSHSGLKETWSQAQHFAEKAVSHLQGFQDNPFSKVLRALPIFLLHRIK